MMNERVRIWNSELANRIDSQLTTQWDRAIFRKMLTQNELDERKLRSFFRRWRLQGECKSFCNFLVDTGLLSLKMRNVDRLDLHAYDSDEKATWVLVTPKACVKLTRNCMFSCVIGDPLERNRLGFVTQVRLVFNLLFL